MLRLPPTPPLFPYTTLFRSFFQLSRRAPRFIKALLRKGVESRLPAGYGSDPDFKPRYNPWDQRPCLVPDGDLDRKSTRLNSSHGYISYAVFCLKKKNMTSLG